MAQSSGPDGMLNDPALRALLEAGGLWLWDADLLNETTKYQPGFWEQYGFDAAAVAETFDFLHVVENEDKREIARNWLAHLEGKAPIYHSEWRLRTPSGERRWISALGSVIEKDSLGKPVRMVGTYTDITATKTAALTLAESLAELDAVFRGSRDGLALVSPDLRILRMNSAAKELVEMFSGFAISEGDDIRNIPRTAQGERPVIGDVQAVLAGNRAIGERSVFVPASGLWIEFAYAPIHYSDGKILGVAVTLRDATERKRMEQNRLQAVRLESLGLMASGIAHDFNNLLMGIMGNIEFAALGLTDPEARDSLIDAQAAAQRASELVDQLLAFAGKQTPIFRPTDLSSLTEEIVRYARRMPGERVQISESLAEGLPSIPADGTQLRQMVLNLLVNALDATRETGGTVRVTTELVAGLPAFDGNFFLQAAPARAYVVIRVSDTGIGMDPATRDRIFDPFFTTKPAGHGLGLATVLGAVRSHGGTISVDSTLGAGSTFSVFLPVSSPGEPLTSA